jgi:hypothetical protein
MRRVALLLALLTALPASAVELKGPMTEGGLIRGQALPGSLITLDGKPIRVAPDGKFVFGFGRDAGPESKLILVDPTGAHQELTLAVAARAWDIRKVDGLPENTVNPDPETQDHIKRDSFNIHEARKADSAESGFAQDFAWPVEGRLSGVFGSQSVLNGTPKSPHLGIDIAAPAGTKLLAPADGVISLADPDMALTGQTVMIDHGLGVSSVFAHLSQIEVKPGDHVTRGQEIGKIGMTGRATGPHTHWGVYWLEVALDPALLVPPMPPQPEKPAEKHLEKGSNG